MVLQYISIQLTSLFMKTQKIKWKKNYSFIEQINTASVDFEWGARTLEFWLTPRPLPTHSFISSKYL